MKIIQRKNKIRAKAELTLIPKLYKNRKAFVI
jgi:hypothetical protein